MTKVLEDGRGLATLGRTLCILREKVSSSENARWRVARVLRVKRGKRKLASNKDGAREISYSVGTRRTEGSVPDAH